MSIRYMCISAAIFFFSLLTYAQEGKWVEVSGKCQGANVTPEEGKRRALESARAEAIKQVVGVKVDEEQFRVQTETMKGDKVDAYFDTFSKLSRSTASGRIVDEEVRYDVVIEGDSPAYIAYLKAKVVQEKGVGDPAFKAEISLPSDVYFDRGVGGVSDELRFKISATKDCYLYIFNLMSNDSVQLLLPNAYLKDNSYVVAQSEQVFEKDIRALGMRFTLSVPSGMQSAKEGLHLIALKQKIDFRGSHLSADALGTIPTYKSAITDILNWLIQIPVEMRTEAFQSYEIRRR